MLAASPGRLIRRGERSLPLQDEPAYGQTNRLDTVAAGRDAGAHRRGRFRSCELQNRDTRDSDPDLAFADRSLRAFDKRLPSRSAAITTEESRINPTPAVPAVRDDLRW